MQSQVVLYKRKEKSPVRARKKQKRTKPAGWVAQSAAGANKKEFKSVCTFLCGPTVGACSTAAFVVSLLVGLVFILFSRVHCEIEYASYVRARHWPDSYHLQQRSRARLLSPFLFTFLSSVSLHGVTRCASSRSRRAFVNEFFSFFFRSPFLVRLKLTATFYHHHQHTRDSCAFARTQLICVNRIIRPVYCTYCDL